MCVYVRVCMCASVCANVYWYVSVCALYALAYVYVKCVYMSIVCKSVCYNTCNSPLTHSCIAY